MSVRRCRLPVMDIDTQPLSGYLYDTRLVEPAPLPIWHMSAMALNGAEPTGGWTTVQDSENSTVWTVVLTTGTLLIEVVGTADFADWRHDEDGPGPAGVQPPRVEASVRRLRDCTGYRVEQLRVLPRNLDRSRPQSVEGRFVFQFKTGNELAVDVREPRHPLPSDPGEEVVRVLMQALNGA